MHPVENSTEPYVFPATERLNSSLADVSYKKDVYSELDFASVLGEKVLMTYEITPDLYTESDVALRLQAPAGYANGVDLCAYDVPPVNSQPRSPMSFAESPDKPLFKGIEKTNTSATYTGPIYLQGNEGTCLAWALIHAINAIGLTPDTALATKLLNAALPSETNERGGLDHFMAAGLISDSAQFTYEFAHELEGQKLTPHQLACFIKEAMDDQGVVIAGVKHPGSGSNHAVCLSGYALDENNYMDLQFIDSNDGEHKMPIEDFTAWANQSGYHFRSLQFVVIRNKANEQQLQRRRKPLFSGVLSGAIAKDLKI